ncbi:MAG: hypothetical protein J6578_09930 [Snodgrassella sp.]|uniref:hypothetical protein n=1 Tax=Snodgrassella sp. TaxID=2815304 RepID=UPI0025853779|nr:hypothetical protein [Snodgrassella sp.]MCO6509084.1 hypothetical protein [Snodgrassella sp.]
MSHNELFSSMHGNHQVANILINELKKTKYFLDQEISNKKIFIDKNQDLCNFSNFEAFPAISLNEIYDLIDNLINKILQLKGENVNTIIKYLNNNLDYFIQKIINCREKLILNLKNPRNFQYFNSLIITLILLENTISSYNITTSHFKRNLIKLDKDIDSQRSNIYRLENIVQSMQSVIKKINNIEEISDSLNSIKKQYLNLSNELTKLEENSKSEINKSIGGFEKELENIKIKAQESLDELNQQNIQAEEMLNQCKKSRDDSAKAYGIAITNGLAGSFKARAKFLNYSTYGWIIGLILSLLALWWIGGNQVQDLKNLYDKQNISSIAILLQALTTILSISAPLWFAWLSTTQINKLFKLAEDYGFKSSVSQSYEGYRKETSDISPELQQDLIKSLLKIINDEPLRLVKDESISNTPYEHMFNNIIEKISSNKSSEKKNDNIKKQSKLNT